MVSPPPGRLQARIVPPILYTALEAMASPSPLPARWAEDVTCPEMTVPQIEEIIAAFAKTALLCKEAGVDGVEVHAVHEAICWTSSP